jgi:hypothetical protein
MMKLFDDTVIHQNVNSMGYHNMAIVFQPCFMRSEKEMDPKTSNINEVLAE